jgi:hypothetical protein
MQIENVTKPAATYVATGLGLIRVVVVVVVVVVVGGDQTERSHERVVSPRREFIVGE